MGLPETEAGGIIMNAIATASDRFAKLLFIFGFIVYIPPLREFIYCYIAVNMLIIQSYIAVKYLTLLYAM